MMQFKMNKTAEQNDWRSYTPEQLNEAARKLDNEKSQPGTPKREKQNTSQLSTPRRQKKTSDVPEVDLPTNVTMAMPKEDREKFHQHMRKSKKVRKKYNMMFEVQKVIKVRSPEKAKKQQDEGDEILDDSPMMKPTIEVVDIEKRHKSVNPVIRRKHKAMLPTVLKQNPAEERDKSVQQRIRDNQLRLEAKKPLMPMKNFRKKANFHRRTIPHEANNSPSPNAQVIKSLAIRKARKVSPVQAAMLGLTTESFRVSPEPASFQNPQLEALARQEKILDKIRRTQVPKKSKDGKLQNVDGRLFILNDSSASKLSTKLALRQYSSRHMFLKNGEQQQPSDLSTQRDHNQSLQVAMEIDPKLEDSDGPQYVQDVSATKSVAFESADRLQSDQRKRQTVTTATGQSAMTSGSNMTQVMPRILVSEEGGCVNLANGDMSEFQSTNASRIINPAMRQKRAGYRTFKDRSKDRDTQQTTSSPPASRQMLSTAGTLPHQQLPSREPEHSSYLVELMRPFANRAGTQGIGSHNNRIMPSSSREPQRTINQTTRLSPIQTRRNTIGTRKESKPPGTAHQYIDDQGMHSISNSNDDVSSSIDTKRSPFRQKDSIEEEPSAVEDNTGTFASPASTTEPHFSSQKRLLQQLKTGGQYDFGMLQSGTGTVTNLKNAASLNMFATQSFSQHQRKRSVFEKSTASKDMMQSSFTGTNTIGGDTYDELPYMTENARQQLQMKRRSQAPVSMKERIKLLPLKVKEELHATQAGQLFEFYEAVLQPSMTPFTKLPKVAGITPKLGDKVSMLTNVRETLTKRFQLAKAARIEARRRLKIVDKIKDLREFIEDKITFRPLPGEEDMKTQLLNRVAFREPELVDYDVEELLSEVYETGALTRRAACAKLIQTWIRMSLNRRKFKFIVSSIIRIQRAFRYSQTRKLFRDARMRLKEQSVMKLQKYLRGYLVYNKYYARLKSTMTKKNLDFIIERYADAKQFMLECLQVKLAYLARKLIKRRKWEAEQRRLAEIAEKKRIAEEKERERLRKIHENRKKKKREVKAMLKEAVEICYQKAEKAREDVYLKEKKKLASQPNKPNKPTITKWDFPLESNQFMFKEQLFEQCYKNIKKRLNAKKKGKNKDLKLDKTTSIMTSNTLKSAALDTSKSPSFAKGTSQMTSPKLGTQASKVDPNAANAAPTGPLLDPHHFAFAMEGRKIRFYKFEKHPDPKKRRKETVTVECTLECLNREMERHIDRDLKMGGASSERSNTPMGKHPKLQNMKSFQPTDPNPVNISIPTQMGQQQLDSELEKVAEEAAGENLDRINLNPSAARRTVDLKSLNRQQTLGAPDRGMEDVRLGNDDLSAVDSIEDASASSENLSINSESYDFLNVFMPTIRPKVVEPDEAAEEEKKKEAAKKDASSKLSKGKGGQRRGSKVSVIEKRDSTTNPEADELSKKNSVALTGNLGILQAQGSIQEQSINEQLNNADIAMPSVKEDAGEQSGNNSPADSPGKLQVSNPPSEDRGITPKYEKQELSIISENDAHADGSPMKIEVHATSQQSDQDNEQPSFMPPKLQPGGSQQQLKSMKALLESEPSQKVFQNPVFVMEPLPEDSDAATRAGINSKLVNSGHSAVGELKSRDGDVTVTSKQSYFHRGEKSQFNEGQIGDGDLTVTSKQSQRPRGDTSRLNENAVGDGELTVTSKQSAMQQSQMQRHETAKFQHQINMNIKSTTTLMTQMGAIYHTQSATIFHHEAKPTRVQPSSTSGGKKSQRDQKQSSVPTGQSIEQIENHDIKSVYESDQEAAADQRGERQCDEKDEKAPLALTQPLDQPSSGSSQRGSAAR